MSTNRTYINKFPIRSCSVFVEDPLKGELVQHIPQGTTLEIVGADTTGIQLKVMSDELDGLFVELSLDMFNWLCEEPYTLPKWVTAPPQYLDV